MSRSSKASSRRSGKLIQTQAHTTQPTSRRKATACSQEPLFSSSFRIWKTIRACCHRWHVLAAHLLGQAGHAGGIASGATVYAAMAACGHGGCHLEWAECSSRQLHLIFRRLATPQMGTLALLRYAIPGCDAMWRGAASPTRRGLARAVRSHLGFSGKSFVGVNSKGLGVVSSRASPFSGV